MANQIQFKDCVMPKLVDEDFNPRRHLCVHEYARHLWSIAKVVRIGLGPEELYPPFDPIWDLPDHMYHNNNLGMDPYFVGLGVVGVRANEGLVQVVPLTHGLRRYRGGQNNLNPVWVWAKYVYITERLRAPRPSNFDLLALEVPGLPENP